MIDRYRSLQIEVYIFSYGISMWDWSISISCHCNQLRYCKGSPQIVTSMLGVRTHLVLIRSGHDPLPVYRYQGHAICWWRPMHITHSYWPIQA